MRRAKVAGLVAVAALAALAGLAHANGATQREIQGHVLSADAGAAKLVVERKFRGKTTRLSLAAPPNVKVFSCSGETAGLDGVKVGMTVSVFYEVAGNEGVANTIVIEPRP